MFQKLLYFIFKIKNVKKDTMKHHDFAFDIS